jgi:hypothetical protein
MEMTQEASGQRNFGIFVMSSLPFLALDWSKRSQTTWTRQKSTRRYRAALDSIVIVGRASREARSTPLDAVISTLAQASKLQYTAMHGLLELSLQLLNFRYGFLKDIGETMSQYTAR